MITKKELLFFSLSFLGLIVFSISGGESKNENSISFDTKEDLLLVEKIKYGTAEQALANQKRLQKSKRDLRVFRTRLTKNNLTSALNRAKSSDDAKSEHNAKKTAVPKVALKKKKDDKKKKDKKKEVAKKNLSPIAPLLPTEEEAVADLSPEFESTDLSSQTYTQNINSQNRKTSNRQDDLDTEVQAAEEQSNADQSVSSLGNTSPKSQVKKTIYTELLESDRFAEFEQLLSSDLSESQRIQSFQDSLNFLFSKSDEDFQNYDSFIRRQFFNDRHAVIISKSLNDPKMTFDQVRYSVHNFNQMIITWDSQNGSNVFKQVYQDNVMVILSQNEERRDLFTGLQSSIEAKSILLSQNSIEVSAN